MPQPVNIAFIISSDGKECHHVLIQLPDGRFYDGGNGIVSERFLSILYPGSRIEVMETFDYDLLDKRSYGLGRSYPECKDYSDAATQRMIDQRLDEAASIMREGVQKEVSVRCVTQPQKIYERSNPR